MPNDIDDKSINNDINEGIVQINTVFGSHDKSSTDMPNYEILNDVKNNTNLIKVLSQDLVVINIDKIRIAYADHILQRTAKGSWLAPTALFLTLLLSLLTTKFTNSFGVSGDSWQSFYMLSCLLTFIWMVIEGKKSLFSPPLDDVESFIKKIIVDKD